MNRTIKEATVSTYHYETERELRTHLHAFLRAHNHARKLKTLKWKTPVETIYQAYHAKPRLFHSIPHQYNLGLNS